MSRISDKWHCKFAYVPVNSNRQLVLRHSRIEGMDSSDGLGVGIGHDLFIGVVISCLNSNFVRYLFQDVCVKWYSFGHLSRMEFPTLGRKTRLQHKVFMSV